MLNMVLKFIVNIASSSNTNDCAPPNMETQMDEFVCTSLSHVQLSLFFLHKMQFAVLAVYNANSGKFAAWSSWQYLKHGPVMSHRIRQK